MIIKGKITILVRDAESLEVKRIIEKENTLTNRTYDRLLSSGSEGFDRPIAFEGLRISLSTNTDIPRIDNLNLTNVIATGFIASDVPSPYFSDDTVIYGEIRNRVLYVGYTRTFQTVGLTTLAANNDHTNNGVSVKATGEVFAYAKLDEPCTQGENEILDLYYRIQFIIPSNPTFSKRYYHDLALAAITMPGVGEFYGYSWGHMYVSTAISSYANKPTLSYDELYSGHAPNTLDARSHQAVIAKAREYYGAQWSNTISISYPLWKKRFTKIYDNNGYVGKIINSVMTGASTTYAGNGFDQSLKAKDDKYTLSAYAIDKFKSHNTSPIQNVFSHTATATVPFHDPQQLANSSLKPVLSLSGSWSNKWPEMYRYEVSTNGSLGTSTYKFKVRRHLGFQGNTWNDTYEHCPFRNPDVAPNPGFHGYRISDKNLHQLTDTKIVQYDTTGITILDLFDGDYRHYDVNTTPALPVTAIGQISLDRTTLKIYVACRNTGLYEIDYTGNTVSLLSNAPCYGVNVGRNKVWAVFNGRLSNSDNWTVAKTFNFIGVSDGNWSKVTYIKADRNHIDNRLAIVYDGRKILWWDEANSIVNVGFQAGGADNSNVFTFRNPRNLNVNQFGQWVACESFSQGDETNAATYYVHKLTYNSNSATDIRVHNNNSCPAWGSVQFNEHGHLIYRDRVVDVALSTSTNSVKQVLPLNGVDTGHTFIYLGKGLAFYGHYLKQIYTNTINTNGTTGSQILNPVLWESYGWDNATWTKEISVWDGNNWSYSNSLAGRPTHNIDYPLINNLQLKWEELNISNPQPLVAGQYYTQSVNYGLLKDNSNGFTHNLNWYLKPINLNQNLSETIPSTFPYVVYVSKSPYGGNDADLSWSAMDYDDVTIHNIQIAGYSTPTITKYVSFDNTTPPAPNEVRINGFTGALSFNSSDAGKNITGTYAYVNGADNRPALRFTGNPLVYPTSIQLQSDLGVNFEGSGWADTSGSNNHATQSISSYRPTIVSNQLNGYDVLSFDGVDDRVNLPFNSVNPYFGWAAVFVLKFDDLSGYQTLLSFGKNETNDGSYVLLNKHINQALYLYLSDINGNGRTISTSVLPLNTNNYYIISIAQNVVTGRAIIRYNKTEQLNAGFFQPQRSNRDSVIFGNRHPGVNVNEPFKGKLAYLSLHEGIFTHYELTQLEQIAATKYNL